MKVLQINTTINSGSTGRIAEDIGQILLMQGHDSFIAFGRANRPSKSTKIKIGSKWDNYWHGLVTLTTDRHGFASESATKSFLESMDNIQPDIIHLHNLHGYYINIKSLFTYLSERNLPIVWTLHDSWSYTGHCTFYESVNCRKWITECHDCPKTAMYPRSLFRDQSRRNYHDKKDLYADYKNMVIVTPSNWLKNDIHQSFLQNHPVHVIYNGVNLEVFKPPQTTPGNGELKTVLGVASRWDSRKGLQDFIALAALLENSYQIVLIGLNKKQVALLPENIKGIERTESVEVLADYYRQAAVFINPTYQDNFPTTNIEALACGTPVITYNTGGSPEAIDKNTGKVVAKGDIHGLKNAIEEIVSKGKEHFKPLCRARAEKYFDKNERYMDYLSLYESMLQNV